MTEGNLNSQETPPQPRTREVVETAIKKVELSFEKLDEELEPLRKQTEELPEEKSELIDAFVRSLDEEEPSKEKIGLDLPSDLMPLATQIKDAYGKARSLEQQRIRLQEQLTPYRKQDFERLTRELSARINYDVVFDYYRERERPSSTSDLLDNTATELYALRKYQYELTHEDGEERDFGFYDRRCGVLEYYLEEWEGKGFLHSEPQEGYEIADEHGKPIAERRRELVNRFGKSLEDLETYNRLVRAYQHTLVFSSHYDYELSNVHRVLDIEGRSYKPTYGYEDFESIDFDLGFIEAAERHVNKVVDEHRKLGHLPPTEESLRSERERIEAIENEKQINGIRAEGFMPPEGMVAVVTPEEILAEAKKILPPDFVQGLQAISRKSRPEKTSEDDPTVETMGRFLPIFDDERRLTATEIEVYRELFAPKDADYLEQALVKSEFMGTVWHEFGHNAHHMMRFDELVAWEKVGTGDEIAITWYVKYAREDAQDRGKREDFSESFEMFITNPALLHTLSPIRYQFMHEYFERRLKSSQVDDFKEHLASQLIITYAVWKKNGYTEEDIKRIYLSHESEK